MAYTCSIAVLDVMTEAGKPLLMKNNKPRFFEALFTLAVTASSAQDLCNTLGLSDDLMLLKDSPHNAIQIPTDSLDSLVAIYQPARGDREAVCTLNGWDVANVYGETLITALNAAKAASKSPTARLFLRMD